MFNCDTCNKNFKSKSALGGHKSQAHGKKEKCPYCNEYFTKTNIVLHKKSCKNKNKCLQCDKPLNRKNEKYCSNICQIKFQREEKFKKIKEGKVLSDTWMKKYLIEKSGNCCDKCGWNEVNAYTGNTPIELDHIDGNYKNSKLDNLRLLCPNCHSLTNTYKGANKGSGRKSR